ncbi:MAG: U32 family peptidase [Clostridiales bacterium]|nr:U32 family peptidase [Clostridiales bacterium]
MKKIELLSPAGDLERLKVTLLYGADACYIGGYKYGLRANAINFSLEEIKEACDFAHSLGKKVYLTMNMVFHNEDYLEVKEYIKEVVERGIDAFILSELNLVSYIKKNYPHVEVHISTQNTNTNYLSVQFLKSLGVDRVVLAREVGINDIEKIRKLVDIDLEVFIHGAMCTFYSGRCALSSYFTNRDANRGGCSQVCRFLFKDDKDSFFSLATKDLNLIDYITKLIDLNVASLKVEGRMRSIYYLATVIGTYRKLIDKYYMNNLTIEDVKKFKINLERVSNRDNSSQYMKNNIDYNDQYYLTERSEKSNQDFLALVLSYDKDNKILHLKQRNLFSKGDKVVLFTPTNELSFIVNEIYDEKDNLIEVANQADSYVKIKLDVDFDVNKYAMIKRD